MFYSAWTLFAFAGMVFDDRNRKTSKNTMVYVLFFNIIPRHIILYYVHLTFVVYLGMLQNFSVDFTY